MDLHDFPQVRVGEPFSRKPSTLPGPLKMDLEEDFPMKDMAIAFDQVTDWDGPDLRETLAPEFPEIGS